MHPLADAFLSQTAPGGPGSILGSPIVFLAIMVAIFYFIVWRPQSAERKKHASFVTGLKKGDQVVTQSGIIGQIVAVEDKTVTLDVGSGTKIRLLKPQVAAPWSDLKAAPAEPKTEAKK